MKNSNFLRIKNSLSKPRHSKRNFLLALTSFVLLGNRWANAQKFNPVQTLQSQFLEYQPVALKKLPIDEILSKAQIAGYDLSPLRDRLNSLK